MNRRQRREHNRRRRRFTRQIDELLDAAQADGRPWTIHGLTDACADCDSVATIHGTPGTGIILADIHHDDSCPAYNGITRWSVA